jgi:radical SAM superfamily enzyme YgiQ (UPF0313 family)
MWQAYATGLLEEQGNDVRLVDAPAWKWGRKDVINDVIKFKPELTIIDSNFASLRNDIEVAEELKKHFDGLKTVVVGPPTSQFAERILKNDAVDIVAKFEYDFTLKELVTALETNADLGKIKGISYKRNGKIINNPLRPFTTSKELDEIPFVSKVYKKHLRINDYFLSHALHPEVQIFTSRGCPQKCIFCSWPETHMGRSYRARSPNNVADEFEYIQNDLPNVREVFIEDDTFTVNKKRVLEICKELKKRGIDISWSCDARADLPYETMKAMKEAGCRLLDVGYESGDDKILSFINKGVNIDQMKVFAKNSKKAGLLTIGDFIFGLPGETKESANKTIKLAKELKPNIVQFVPATPIPGTEFYTWAKREGYLLEDNLEKSLNKEGFQRCIISYPEFTKEDIERYVDFALKNYYLNPSFIPIALNTILRKNGIHELKVIMKSAIMFFRYLWRDE